MKGVEVKRGRRQLPRPAELLGITETEKSLEQELVEVIRERWPELIKDIKEFIHVVPGEVLGQQRREWCADVFIIEQAVGGQLWKGEERKRFEEELKRNLPILTTEAESLVIRGGVGSLSYGAWAQIAPEDRDWIYLDTDRLRSAIRLIQTEPENVISLERRVVNLMQMRPDSRGELMRVLDPENSVLRHEWDTKEQIMNERGGIRELAERLAAWRLIDPRTHDMFQLSVRDKQRLIEEVRNFTDIKRLTGLIRDVCIVLAEEAELTDTGAIQIRMKKPELKQAPDLPGRDLLS